MTALMGIFTETVLVSLISHIDRNKWFYKGKSVVTKMARGWTREEFHAASVTLTYHNPHLFWMVYNKTVTVVA